MKKKSLNTKLKIFGIILCISSIAIPIPYLIREYFMQWKKTSFLTNNINEFKSDKNGTKPQLLQELPYRSGCESCDNDLPKSLGGPETLFKIHLPDLQMNYLTGDEIQFRILPNFPNCIYPPQPKYDLMLNEIIGNTSRPVTCSHLSVFRVRLCGPSDLNANVENIPSPEGSYLIRFKLHEAGNYQMSVKLMFYEMPYLITKSRETDTYAAAMPRFNGKHIIDGILNITVKGDNIPQASTPCPPNQTLHGRWIQTDFFPFDCKINKIDQIKLSSDRYYLNWYHMTSKPIWIRFVGDSNIRNLVEEFRTWFFLKSSTLYMPPPEWNKPTLFISNNIIVTYEWITLDPGKFQDMINQKTLSSWCTNISNGCQNMTQLIEQKYASKSTDYLIWSLGSHQLWTSSECYQFFHEEIIPNLVNLNPLTSFIMTTITAKDTSQLPPKFSPIQPYTTNERVNSINQVMMNEIFKLQNQIPSMKNQFHILDFFGATVGIVEENGDAQHFYGPNYDRKVYNFLIKMIIAKILELS